MKTSANIAVLILAAGQSLRMKGIKQLLPWKGSNLLLHTVNTIINLREGKVYVVLGANAERIKSESKLESYPVSLIQNEDWEKGLGSSIARGVDFILRQEKSIDGILICLADQPLLQTGYYKKLVATFKGNNAPIVATKYPKKAGVPAIFNLESAQELIHLNEDHGARHLMSKNQNKLIVLDAGEDILDIDTPESYQLLYKQYNHNKE